MSEYEHPDARRARRLREAREARNSPERLAQVEEIRRRQAAEAEAAAARGTSSPRTRSSSPSSRAPRAPKAPPAPKVDPGMFGHPWPEWFAMRDAAVGIIGEAAAERRLLTADELWAGLGAALGKDLGDARFKLPRLLVDVATQGAEQLRLLPNAIVVPSAQAGPGRSFFKVANDLGLLPGLFIPLGDEGFAMPADLRAFWREQVEATFDHYEAAATDPAASEPEVGAEPEAASGDAAGAEADDAPRDLDPDEG